MKLEQNDENFTISQFPPLLRHEIRAKWRKFHFFPIASPLNSCLNLGKKVKKSEIFDFCSKFMSELGEKSEKKWNFPFLPYTHMLATAQIWWKCKISVRNGHFHGKCYFGEILSKIKPNDISWVSRGYNANQNWSEKAQFGWKCKISVKNGHFHEKCCLLEILRNIRPNDTFSCDNANTYVGDSSNLVKMQDFGEKWSFSWKMLFGGNFE